MIVETEAEDLFVSGVAVFVATPGVPITLQKNC